MPPKQPTQPTAREQLDKGLMKCKVPAGLKKWVEDWTSESTYVGQPWRVPQRRDFDALTAPVAGEVQVHLQQT